jgi:hemerythrin-like domain-containing protein
LIQVNSAPGPTRSIAFMDPREKLASCHERIEAQLRSLEQLAARLPAGGADPVAQGAAKDVLGYFETAAAQHHRDEDDDLFPLLRSRAGALGRNEVAAAIDELEREHATMESQWGRLRGALGAIAAAGKAEFGAHDVERFAWLYRRHMERESLLVLPFAREVLTQEERAGLGERMAARRARP